MYGSRGNSLYSSGGVVFLMSNSIACIIYKNGKILIAHRNPVGDMGGRWEFPGGKVDAGETEQQAIIREMYEEFSVVAVPGKKITECVFFHKEKKCTLNAYFVELEHDGMKSPYVLTEHTEYAWVDPAEIPKDNFVDSDLQIYPAVLKALEKKYE